jgi:hypothetical protein
VETEHNKEFNNFYSLPHIIKAIPLSNMRWAGIQQTEGVWECIQHFGRNV